MITDTPDAAYVTGIQRLLARLMFFGESHRHAGEVSLDVDESGDLITFCGGVVMYVMLQPAKTAGQKAPTE